MIAHRGASGTRPENTLAAFQRAIDLGADMIELDVTLTRDEELVVIHDETLERTTDGRGPVRSLLLEEIRRLDAGSWFAPEFAGERVPTLAEVLERLRGRVLLNVEIKEEAVTDVLSNGIAERVVTLIREKGAPGAVILSSFDPRALEQAREVGPEIPRASLYDEKRHAGLDPREIMDRVGAVVFSPGREQLSPEMVAACHAAGRLITVYTVDEADEMRRMIELGVDGLFTDFPERLIEVLGP